MPSGRPRKSLSPPPIPPIGNQAHIPGQRGPQKVRMFGEALDVVLRRVVVDPNSPTSEKKKTFMIIAEKVVDMAMNGDLGAIREVMDRVDGKTIQQVNVADQDGNTIPSGIAVVFVHNTPAEDPQVIIDGNTG